MWTLRLWYISINVQLWRLHKKLIFFPFLTVYDYRTIDRTISLTAGSPEYSNYELTLDAYLDGLAEELEGFVLYLDVIESELDPRDVGQVSLSRSVYLVVINQSGVIYFILLGIDGLLLYGFSLIRYFKLPSPHWRC